MSSLKNRNSSLASLMSATSSFSRIILSSSSLCSFTAMSRPTSSELLRTGSKYRFSLILSADFTHPPLPLTLYSNGNWAIYSFESGSISMQSGLTAKSPMPLMTSDTIFRLVLTHMTAFRSLRIICSMLGKQ